MTDPRTRIPAVNALLGQARASARFAAVSRPALVAAIRDVLAAARLGKGDPPPEGWLAALQQRLDQRQRNGLRPVINATGVVLHTNLGRAPLAPEAIAAMNRAVGYSTLEYDLETGERGSRQHHVRGLLCQLTGSQDALVVNNAAAALLLVCNTLAAGHETIVSRGELVEIGDAFRIPEILERSGTLLAEIGTTNRTRLADYQAALSPRTRAVLKVHRSNFRVAGFTGEVEVADLITTMRPRGIPVIHDVGSGLLVDLERFGLTGEPLVRAGVAQGAVVVCSGDKLLGGPQAGLVLGPAEVVRAAARNPLARALRPDKCTVAALEATLRLYQDPDAALLRVPVLAMLTADSALLRRRARRLARLIGEAETVAGSSSVGGGAFPEANLSTTLIALEAPSCDALLAALRRHDPPVIARAADGRVLLDIRTIGDADLSDVANAVRRARETAARP
ncbi:MAG TPA: L-seryl-tRNA(Sec) selenium transferase [Gemmatimonadales bacterium]|nr:L-seryl-tRNA(Sec) selenium transferase [Gemmatimonadales bacterium]